MSNTPTPDRKKVYIIHGYGASPSSHWFPWLRDRLTEAGADVAVLTMPNPQEPNFNAWVNQLSASVPDLDGNTYFVAHSLGCITTLRYLLRQNPAKPIGGIVLVSGFAKPLPELPILDAFTEQPLDYDRVIRSASGRAVIAAKDDSIVPFAYSKELMEQIHADFYEVEHGGHFLESDGFTTLPIVFDVLNKMLCA
ncbi:RBBP9/YdeN family alpha/beta hydrolase [Paenibacillus macerans]|uniref:Putative hydrolase ydeN n=1 Tax=Paenibacillus macerans TaxID=44252 RepID=A0A090YAZ1_PAEMA|nr:alpha/beta fold hydrolase [Paenibacillus macerans]KFM95953.1 putative hydrolase ydeN [Paenibacillus macerans]MCY7562742.1 alpha/beta hydrolase [Paenibacillus macerans]MEC0152792.1 alpha/beta hydrolase [Paenibacillus macerans]MED4954591.1 alpha/beta hydrolase [Paenibacillus macerans]SUA83888.1 putative hydrolase ydeN [Paenibacillus macerans]